MNANRWERMGMAILVAVGFLWASAGPGGLEAREKKRGAWVSIQKSDGIVVEGELLLVKERDLVLMDGANNGVSLSIDDIARVEVVKERKGPSPIVAGILAGGALGAAMGAIDAQGESGGFKLTPAGGAAIGGLMFGALGLLIGAAVSGGESIEIPAGSEAGKLNALKKLAGASKAGGYYSKR